MSARALRHIAQQAAILGMEAVTLAALARLLGMGDALIPVPLFLLTGWLLFAALRWLHGLELWVSPRGRVLIALVGLAGVSLLVGQAGGGFVAGPVTLLRALADIALILTRQAPLSAALLTGAFLFYRALLVVVTEIGQMSLGHRIVWTLPLLMLALIVLEGERGSLPWEALIPYGIFLLLALVLTRTRDLDLIPGTPALPVTPRWGTVLLAGVGATLVAGLLLQWFSQGWIARIGELLRPLWNLFVTLLAIPVGFLLWLLEPLFQAIADSLEIQLPARSSDTLELGDSNVLPPDPAYWNIEQWLAIAMVFFFVFVVLMMLRQAYLRRRVGGAGGFAPQSDYGRGEQARWFPFQFRNPFAPRREYAIETVRDLYKNLLAFGESQGIHRPDDATPYEYLQPLAAQHPSVRAELTALTEAYVAAHYGEINFSRGDIARLQAAWQKIRSLPPLESAVK